MRENERNCTEHGAFVPNVLSLGSAYENSRNLFASGSAGVRVSPSILGTHRPEPHVTDTQLPLLVSSTHTLVCHLLVTVRNISSKCHQITKNSIGRSMAKKIPNFMIFFRYFAKMVRCSLPSLPPLGESAPLLWGILDMPLSLQIHLELLSTKTCMQSSLSQLKFVYIIEIERNENFFFKDLLLAPPSKKPSIFVAVHVKHNIYTKHVLCPVIYTDTDSQGYFALRLLNNASEQSSSSN